MALFQLIRSSTTHTSNWYYLLVTAGQALVNTASPSIPCSSKTRTERKHCLVVLLHEHHFSHKYVCVYMVLCIVCRCSKLPCYVGYDLVPCAFLWQTYEILRGLLCFSYSSKWCSALCTVPVITTCSWKYTLVVIVYGSVQFIDVVTLILALLTHSVVWVWPTDTTFS